LKENDFNENNNDHINKLKLERSNMKKKINELDSDNSSLHRENVYLKEENNMVKKQLDAYDKIKNKEINELKEEMRKRISLKEQDS
jgi:FtsZ-binding cell division protein ZapB